jgi:hypothetical protein
MTNVPAIDWRKSSHSHSSGECVEVAALSSGMIGVRDSKNPRGPHLTLDPRAFRDLLDRVTATGATTTGATTRGAATTRGRGTSAWSSM